MSATELLRACESGAPAPRLREMPENFVVIDCETSGLDPARHTLLSLAAIKPDGSYFIGCCRPWGVRPLGAPGSLVWRWSQRLLHAWGRAPVFDPEALRVNGMSEAAAYQLTPVFSPGRVRTLVCAGSPRALLLELARWLVRPEGEVACWVMGGRNPGFDRGFMTLPEGRRGGRMVLPIARRLIDLHQWAYAWALEAGIDLAHPQTETYATVYRAMGFAPEPEPHTALRGAWWARDVFAWFMRRWGPAAAPILLARARDGEGPAVNGATQWRKGQDRPVSA